MNKYYLAYFLAAILTFIIIIPKLSIFHDLKFKQVDYNSITASEVSKEINDHNVPMPYGVDKNNVYFFDEIIKEADPRTFEPIITEALKEELIVKEKGYLYSKDSNNVYYCTQKIPEADPETFEVISLELAKDKNNIYNMDPINCEIISKN